MTSLNKQIGELVSLTTEIGTEYEAAKKLLAPILMDDSTDPDCVESIQEDLHALRVFLKGDGDEYKGAEKELISLLSAFEKLGKGRLDTVERIWALGTRIEEVKEQVRDFIDDPVDDLSWSTEDLDENVRGENLGRGAELSIRTRKIRTLAERFISLAKTAFSLED